MSDLAIKVDNLSKRYKIGARKNRHDTLRDHVVHGIQSLFSRNQHATSLNGKTMAQSVDSISSRNTLRSPDDDFIWALKDVSFDIKKGEVVGFIGRNGAGKSTLLKILSRITEPTKGRAEIYGRVGCLLEVGTGFHPELTGRENIYLNGSILGMKTWEINNKFDDIVAFSEIEKFIDTPVKRYSSGMYVRLAFAVAAHLEPEILIIDEVLAVGDSAFQKKCLGKMGAVAEEGRTVLFVSHNTAALQSICKRAVWISNGRVARDGEPISVIGEYLDDLERDSSVNALMSSNGEMRIERVVIKDGKGEIKSSFQPQSTMTIEMHYVATTPIQSPHFWIAISAFGVGLFGANMLLDGYTPRVLQGHGRISCTFPKLPLLPQQKYVVLFGAYKADGRSHLFKSTVIKQIQVIGSAKDIGFEGERAETAASVFAPVLVPYRWELTDEKAIDINPVRSEVRNGRS